MADQWILTCTDPSGPSEGEGSPFEDCSALQWHLQPENPGVLPPLSASDATEIAAAIAGVWFLGFVVRQLVRTVRQ